MLEFGKEIFVLLHEPGVSLKQEKEERFNFKLKFSKKSVEVLELSLWPKIRNI